MELHDKINITVSNNKMEAYIDLIEPVEDSTTEALYALLEEKNICFGIIDKQVSRIAGNEKGVSFPLLIAVGKKPRDGENGSVLYDKDVNFQISTEDKVNFRDIINIPSVVEGERIASIIAPTKGEPGKNVFGETIEASTGKPAKIKAGKNTSFKKSDQSFYANVSGQLNLGPHYLQVQPLFEVQGDIDLKTGNLDFVGSIVIYGSIPTGYKVKAEGDITIHGLVEGAEVQAGGSVFISEGISGLGKAMVQSGLDIRVGYINQAHVEAGKDLFVEQSILHSQCVAQESIYCQNGHIIGGTLSAGFRIEAKDIGNRMNTPTGLYIGINKKVEEKLVYYKNLLEKKQEERRKLLLIGSKLEQLNYTKSLGAKERVTLLRQRNSLDIINKDLTEVTEQIDGMTSEIGDLTIAFIQANGWIYPFVHLGFGKYQYRVNEIAKRVRVCLLNGEIKLSQIND